jgi:hypothetical protein
MWPPCEELHSLKGRLVEFSREIDLPTASAPSEFGGSTWERLVRLRGDDLAFGFRCESAG